MAQRAMMGRKTFTRRFQQLAGTSFLSWLLTGRLALGQRLLESTDAPIDVVADKAGFGSSESLRLHFRRHFGFSPTEWTRQFRGWSPIRRNQPFKSQPSADVEAAESGRALPFRVGIGKSTLSDSSFQASAFGKRLEPRSRPGAAVRLFRRPANPNAASLKNLP
jgi:AraC-like DNA-binding protein